MSSKPRIVITGLGLTAPNGNSLSEFRANLLAALTTRADAVNTVYNVAAHRQTTLNQLFDAMRAELVVRFPDIAKAQAQHQDFRAGDVRHSLADISKAQTLLGYAPTIKVGAGVAAAMPWYVGQAK